MLCIVNPVSEEFWACVVGQDHGDFKSNRLHVDVFWFCFIHLRCIL